MVSSAGLLVLFGAFDLLLHQVQHLSGGGLACLLLVFASLFHLKVKMVNAAHASVLLQVRVAAIVWHVLVGRRPVQG